MSAKRWALSAFFVWHIASTVLGALASSNTVQPVASVSVHPPSNLLAAILTPVFDRIAVVAAPIPAALDWAAGPVGGVFDAYLALAGLGQNWKMFYAPPDVHQYLRARYYVGPRGDNGKSAGAPTWTATELILPAHREDQIRFLQSYRDSYRDKALAVALERFQRARDVDLVRRDTTSAELPDDLAPVARYFARRFERVTLRPDERVLRTEIWYGTAPIPPPGSTPDPTLTEARWAVLREYYGEPVQNHVGRPTYPVYHRVEREADISWVLDYFEP
jgi:hypothetical protein